jgi:hypothetical protein
MLLKRVASRGAAVDASERRESAEAAEEVALPCFSTVFNLAFASLSCLFDEIHGLNSQRKSNTKYFN